jgi:hypothetical protein
VESAHKICRTPSQNLLSLKMRQANGTVAMVWGWRFPEGAPVKHFFHMQLPWDYFISSTDDTSELSGVSDLLLSCKGTFGSKAKA